MFNLKKAVKGEARFYGVVALVIEGAEVEGGGSFRWVLVEEGIQETVGLSAF